MRRISTIRYSLSAKERYKRVIAAVHMVYRLVNSTYSTKELLIRLTRIICQLVGASSSCVHVLDNHGKKLKLIAVFNGKINILYEKKADLDKATRDETFVVRGGTIVRERFIGLPLVSDENIGAIFMRRTPRERPLSPHLVSGGPFALHWRWHITMFSSIAHRATGVALRR